MIRKFSFFIFIFLSQNMIAQNISFYTNKDENFADVTTSEGFVFTCRVGGIENNGDAIILLHGFPETSRMWMNLIEVLSKNGYKVIAPDQRGYSKGARPSKIEDYRVSKLTKDVFDIADTFDIDKFHLVGHDWGSAVGWSVAASNKDRIISYSALSVPHVDAFSEAIVNDEIQTKKSYYIDLFKIKYLPEFYFKIFNFWNLKKVLSSSNKDEINNYLEVFSQKDALKSALNWYRATDLGGSKKIGDIYVPTLMIYGTQDMAIGEKGIDETEKFIKSFYRLKKIDSSHWLIQDSFDVVSKEILDHVNKHGSNAQMK